MALDCTKAKALEEEGDALRNAQVAMLTAEWQPLLQKRDVSGARPLSCCAVLGFSSELPQAEHLPTVVQINRARVDEPMRGTDIMDKSGQRIWFLTKLHDITGSVQVGVPERCALALANLRGQC